MTAEMGLIFWSDMFPQKVPTQFSVCGGMRQHAAAGFRTSTNRPPKQVLRHASTVGAWTQSHFLMQRQGKNTDGWQSWWPTPSPRKGVSGFHGLARKFHGKPTVPPPHKIYHHPEGAGGRYCKGVPVHPTLQHRFSHTPNNSHPKQSEQGSLWLVVQPQPQSLSARPRMHHLQPQ